DPGAAQHFFDHWLADSSELGRKAVDRVMRHAYDQAIRLATRADGVVPIETFWVTGAGDDFEIHLCDGPQRITVFVFIPGVAGGSTSTESRSWVIRVGRDPGAERLDDEDPPVLKVQVSGPEPGASS
ncbi:MAG TPA: hypothetical protein VFC99_11515, partial [Acidimicrobiia bacterium]|nr:hypothetical protein [Acidimicrobiia bacterium]